MLRIFLLLIFLSFPALAVDVKPAKENVTVIYDAVSGEPLMVVVDAKNLNDPAWNPSGTKQKPIPVDTYNKFTGAADLSDYLSGAKQ